VVRSDPTGDAPADAVVPATDPETVTEAEVEGLRTELAERSDQLLRLAADFENFRRRKAQELTDRGRYASEEAAQALLPCSTTSVAPLATQLATAAASSSWTGFGW